MFRNRSHIKELLDGDVSKKDLYHNLKELHSINRLLGGYRVSINALKKLNLDGKTLIDIGSGGGDMLNEIYQFSLKRNIDCHLYGIDLKSDCTQYAKDHLPHNLSFITDDYRNAPLHVGSIDVIHACLFTHHLEDHEIIELIEFSINNGCVLLVNDLERNRIAYYAIKWLTRLFSRSLLVKNDAPLSVLRGFRRKEWLSYLQGAGATRYSVKWKWAFRYQVIVYE
jgi:2-polyprenyl-3-methyl-5-hydroxy-6-metoxy-1,4-benzoquinol methylase